VAASDWPVPLRSDRVCEPLDLKKNGWNRSERTYSLSDLICANTSRSNGLSRSGSPELGFRQPAARLRPEVNSDDAPTAFGGDGDVYSMQGSEVNLIA
jgi:hypothetical protein